MLANLSDGLPRGADGLLAILHDSKSSPTAPHVAARGIRIGCSFVPFKGEIGSGNERVWYGTYNITARVYL